MLFCALVQTKHLQKNQMLIDLAFLQLDTQKTTITCMEEMFDSVLQMKVWPGYILQLVATELPATVHCTNSKGPQQIHCTARVKRLQFYAHSLVRFHNKFLFM